MMSRMQENVASHGHDFFELVYVTGGTAKHTRNGNVSMLKKGDYFIMDYKSVHCYEDGQDFSLINCLFLPQVIDETLDSCETLDALLQGCLIRYYRMTVRDSWSNRIFHDEDGRVEALLRGMLVEYQEKRFGCEEIFRCRLTEILILTLRNLLPLREKELQSDVIAALLIFLEGNFKLQAPLQEFCNRYHYSLSYISRRFKQETGKTVREYIQKIRIEKSCEFLEGSNLRVSEIAQLVGYEDMKFFHEMFRRLVHMTPLEYRKVRRRSL